jgi:hypothetical protein
MHDCRRISLTKCRNRVLPLIHRRIQLRDNTLLPLGPRYARESLRFLGRVQSAEGQSQNLSQLQSAHERGDVGRFAWRLFERVFRVRRVPVFVVAFDRVVYIIAAYKVSIFCYRSAISMHLLLVLDQTWSAEEGCFHTVDV